MQVDELPIILIFACTALAPIAVGVVYFVKARADSSLWLRTATSAYAPSIGLLFIAVGAFWPDSHQYNARGVRLLWQLQLVPLLLLGASLALYPGPRKLHLLLVPTSLVLWLWILGMSWVSVHGK